MHAIDERNGRGPEPVFDVPVPQDGYRWWYLDGISDDGRFGVVVISFVGSVFSPYYFRARQSGDGDPENFVAINVALYGPHGNRWAMTERGRESLERSASHFRVGPSGLSWQDDRLVVEISERSAPFARRVAGRIEVQPDYFNTRRFELDAGGRHSWRPIAPAARISVDMQSPSVRWQGGGYLDTNAGERALEDDFENWNWSRGEAAGKTAITYAVNQRDGEQRALALSFDSDGKLREFSVPPEVQLPRTGWLVDRPARAASIPAVRRTLEDTPFYSRSMLDGQVDGQPARLVHESLAMNRFRSAWVRMLLPFRMPRVR